MARVDAVLAEVGRRVRDARVRAGLTQEGAAAAASIDVKRWQRLEAGEVNATIRTLIRAAAACRMTIWELLDARPGVGAQFVS